MAVALPQAAALSSRPTLPTPSTYSYLDSPVTFDALPFAYQSSPLARELASHGELRRLFAGLPVFSQSCDARLGWSSVNLWSRMAGTLISEWQEHEGRDMGELLRFLQVIAEDELAAHLNPHRLRLATLNPSDALLRSLLTRIELRWSSTLDWVLIGVLGSLCKSFGVRLVKKSSQGSKDGSHHTWVLYGVLGSPGLAARACNFILESTISLLPLAENHAVEQILSNFQATFVLHLHLALAVQVALLVTPTLERTSSRALLDAVHARLDTVVDAFIVEESTRSPPARTKRPPLPRRVESLPRPLEGLEDSLYIGRQAINGVDQLTSPSKEAPPEQATRTFARGLVAQVEATAEALAPLRSLEAEYTPGEARSYIEEYHRKGFTFPFSAEPLKISLNPALVAGLPPVPTRPVPIFLLPVASSSRTTTQSPTSRRKRSASGVVSKSPTKKRAVELSDSVDGVTVATCAPPDTCANDNYTSIEDRPTCMPLVTAERLSVLFQNIYSGGKGYAEPVAPDSSAFHAKIMELDFPFSDPQLASNPDAQARLRSLLRNIHVNGGRDVTPEHSLRIAEVLARRRSDLPSHLHWPTGRPAVDLIVGSMQGTDTGSVVVGMKALVSLALTFPVGTEDHIFSTRRMDRASVEAIAEQQGLNVAALQLEEEVVEASGAERDLGEDQEDIVMLEDATTSTSSSSSSSSSFAASSSSSSVVNPTPPTSTELAELGVGALAVPSSTTPSASSSPSAADAPRFPLPKPLCHTGNTIRHAHAPLPTFIQDASFIFDTNPQSRPASDRTCLDSESQEAQFELSRPLLSALPTPIIAVAQSTNRYRTVRDLAPRWCCRGGERLVWSSAKEAPTGWEAPNEEEYERWWDKHVFSVAQDLPHHPLAIFVLDFFGTEHDDRLLIFQSHPCGVNWFRATPHAFSMHARSQEATTLTLALLTPPAAESTQLLAEWHKATTAKSATWLLLAMGPKALVSNPKTDFIDPSNVWADVQRLRHAEKKSKQPYDFSRAPPLLLGLYDSLLPGALSLPPRAPDNSHLHDLLSLRSAFKLPSLAVTERRLEKGVAVSMRALGILLRARESAHMLELVEKTGVPTADLASPLVFNAALQRRTKEAQANNITRRTLMETSMYLSLRLVSAQAQHIYSQHFADFAARQNVAPTLRARTGAWSTPKPSGSLVLELTGAESSGGRRVLSVTSRGRARDCAMGCEERGEPCTRPWVEAVEELSTLYGEEEVRWLLRAWERALDKHGVAKGSTTREGRAWHEKARGYGELAAEWEQREA